MICFGILGFGHHGVKRLAPGFSFAHDSALTGIWRRDEVKARANARQFDIPHVFPTAEALCASAEIDAVFVASPDSHHLADVLLALAHGKPVLCEKPLAMNTGEVEQMLAAAHKAGVAFGVAQNMRFHGSLQLMRKWLAEGRIGRPLLAHSQFCYAAESSPRQWIYDPALALGGPIGDVGVHCMDALRFILASEVTSVNTLAIKDAQSGAVESSAVVSAEFVSGTLGVISVTTRGAYRSLIEITGDAGVLSCEDALTVDHPVEVRLIQGGRVIASEQVSNEDSYGRMVDSFSAAIEGKAPFLSPGEDGLRNQLILDAAYKSWRTG
ncbi:MAG TPA: Gfo/Idh/MocA family oxidoreductase, partial [Acidisarcina sp.]